MVRLLLETKRVDVDSKDKGNRTPLSYTTEKRHKAVVKLLLKTKGVGADLKDKDPWKSL